MFLDGRKYSLFFFLQIFFFNCVLHFWFVLRLIKEIHHRCINDWTFGFLGLFSFCFVGGNETDNLGFCCVLFVCSTKHSSCFNNCFKFSEDKNKKQHRLSGKHNTIPLNEETICKNFWSVFQKYACYQQSVFPSAQVFKLNILTRSWMR